MSGELHVQNLGKSYRQWGSELRRIASWFAPSIAPREEHWVLKDDRTCVGVLLQTATPHPRPLPSRGERAERSGGRGVGS